LDFRDAKALDLAEKLGAGVSTDEYHPGCSGKIARLAVLYLPEEDFGTLTAWRMRDFGRSEATLGVHELLRV